jgi:acetolactate decarboxylase
MRTLRAVIPAATLFLLLAAHAGAASLVQFSILDALMHGLYEAPFPFTDVKRSGDFGLGTMNGLDGEMIGDGGAFYRILPDGRAVAVADTEQTPFAVVTFFRPDRSVPVPPQATFEALQHWLDAQTGSPNLYAAIRIRGVFSMLQARSVIRQSPPYRPLTEVVKGQAVFEWKDVRGTLVGFRSPSYAKALNVPGYHFHFLSDDRQRGGHVLGCSLAEGTAEIESIDDFEVRLPGKDAAFRAADLATHDEAAVQKVERQTAPAK